MIHSDVEISFPVPCLPGDESDVWKSDSDTSMSSCSSSSSSSSCSSSSPMVSYQVRLPLFTSKQIDGVLLRVWTVKPQAGYLQNINQVHLHSADLSIWRTSRGLLLRNLVVKHRATFMKSLYRSVSREDTTAAADTMIRDLDNWITELRTYARTTPRGNRRTRKATELVVKQRSLNFTYRETLTKFGRDPSVTTLQALRASFKELWVNYRGLITEYI